MVLLRDDRDFQTAIDRAAADLGETPAFVEKDYWVTQTLRALRSTIPGGFVLKGGTSLSKGYGVINRFSEDVDILIVPNASESISSSERRLQRITSDVADWLSIPWREARAPGRGNHPHRGDHLTYSDRERGKGLPITPDVILLETRIGDGQEPSEMVTISPILAMWREVQDQRFDDLDAFDVRALEARRTLIEKVVGVHHAISNWDPESPPVQSRFGRHYYDIFCLLGHEPTLVKLQDRVRFGHILRDVEISSEEFYDGYTERPLDGFASGPAFQPGKNNPMRDWLESSYRTALELLSPTEPRPTLGQVLQRIENRAALL